MFLSSNGAKTRKQKVESEEEKITLAMQNCQKQWTGDEVTILHVPTTNKQRLAVEPIVERPRGGRDGIEKKKNHKTLSEFMRYILSLIIKTEVDLHAIDLDPHFPEKTRANAEKRRPKDGINKCLRVHKKLTGVPMAVKIAIQYNIPLPDFNVLKKLFEEGVKPADCTASNFFILKQMTPPATWEVPSVNWAFH